MKVPLSWLRTTWTSCRRSPAAAPRLTIAGVEVERVSRRGLPERRQRRSSPAASLEAGKHPNADRLQLCRVDTGDPEPRQIVCGAWNFGAGDTVAVAVPGRCAARRPRLERAKLRGLVSDGMILSERELDLSQEHGGILVLATATRPGEPLGARASAGDVCSSFEVSSNRSDLLSVRGVARDVAAVFDLRLRPLDERRARRRRRSRPTRALVHVAIDDLELCPRFTARALQGVRVGPSPLWLKARLTRRRHPPDLERRRRHELRRCTTSDSPLHAYDLARIPGHELVARRARARRAADARSTARSASSTPRCS